MDEITLQNECERIVRNEVRCCLSSIMSTLAQGYSERIEGSDLATLAEQAAELAMPIDDYEEAARQEGWKAVSAGLDDGTIRWVNEEREPGDTDFDGTAEELCQEHDIEPCQWEVYEHWAVSSWLAEKLIEQGERVDTDFAGLSVWARTTTGQAISMDGVIRRIVRDLHKVGA